ncbi:MAG: DUF7261 family protein [Halobacteriota archaeon]
MTDGWRGTTKRDGNRARGQLVLVAAVVVAVALVPMLVAYLQLGYHADVTTRTDGQSATTDARQYVRVAVDNASTATAGGFEWSAHDAAATRLTSVLDPDLRRLETARVEQGIAADVRRNQTAAESWTAEHCPRGPNRQFGPCDSGGGVVLQARAGEATVLAVVVDLHVTTPRTETNETLVVGLPGVE